MTLVGPVLCLLFFCISPLQLRPRDAARYIMPCADDLTHAFPACDSNRSACRFISQGIVILVARTFITFLGGHCYNRQLQSGAGD